MTTLEKFESQNLDPNRVPRHIAIIMDGNGRWAERQDLPRLHGHIHGYQTVHTIIEAAADIGVEAVTLYTFSVENWRRPQSEVEGIMRLIADAAHQEISKLMDKNVQLRLCGRIAGLPEYVREALQADVEATKQNNRLVLNLAINYGGRAEVVDACKAIAEKVKSGEISTEDITEELFSQNVYQPGLPEPDLMIRTAGEMRTSNFLIWEAAYAELHVTQTLWPDFTDDDLLKAVADYQTRVRKFGKVVLESEQNKN